jgi:hypothetical protein
VSTPQFDDVSTRRLDAIARSRSVDGENATTARSPTRDRA